MAVDLTKARCAKCHGMLCELPLINSLQCIHCGHIEAYESVCSRLAQPTPFPDEPKAEIAAAGYHGTVNVPSDAKVTGAAVMNAHGTVTVIANPKLRANEAYFMTKEAAEYFVAERKKHRDGVWDAKPLAQAPAIYVDGVRVEGVDRYGDTWAEVKGKRIKGRVEVVNGDGVVKRDDGWNAKPSSRRRWV